MGFFGFYFYGWLNGDCVISIDFFFCLCLASMIVIGITPSFFFFCAECGQDICVDFMVPPRVWEGDAFIMTV